MCLLFPHSLDLIGIWACLGTQIQDLLSVFVREMVSVSNFISPDEVSRAKNQLKSSLLMNLESKPIVAEDIGRQLLGLGYRIEPEALLEHIGLS